MNVKRILIFLLIIAIMLTYNIVLGNRSFYIKLNIDKPYSCISNRLECMFNAVTYRGRAEYRSDGLLILGGNNMLLPNRHGHINIQCCLKEKDSGCTIILAYPALPLESY